YASNGNLRQYLLKNEIKWPEKVQLASQIAEGMSYIHSLNIIHCNLHTLNILIHNRNVKISDFKLSKNLNCISAANNEKNLGVIPFVDPRIRKS
ncbi:4210_t:CDS:2, partial [Dentiscutata heterogama]